MSKTRERDLGEDVRRLTEEEQGKNPLAGLFEITQKKEIKFREERIDFKPCCIADENGEQSVAFEVRTNDQYAGELFYDPKSRKWYSLGLKQTGLDGKDKADRVGASPNFDQAVKTMLKLRWPQEFKVATSL